MRSQLAQTPLEILASIINKYDHLRGVGLRLFSAYDEFLSVLSDQGKRDHLNELKLGGEDGDAIFEDLRRVSHTFRDALNELFFDTKSGLAELTKTYGVF